MAGKRQPFARIPREDGTADAAQQSGKRFPCRPVPSRQKHIDGWHPHQQRIVVLREWTERSRWGGHGFLYANSADVEMYD
jgi:hypothetical protein